MSKVRLRIHFTKMDDLRWISHRDLARLWERLLRRAGLELAFSEGFHPKPKISFPSALALGTVALDEIVELDLVGPVDLEAAHEQIAQNLPGGMTMLSMSQLPPGAPKALVVAATYSIQLPAADVATAREQLDRLHQAGKVTIQREGKTLEAAFDDPRFQISCEGDVLRFTLPTNAQGSLRPSELLQALGIAHVLPDGAVLTRTNVHLMSDRSGSIVGAETHSAATTTSHQH